MCRPASRSSATECAIGARRTSSPRSTSSTPMASETIHRRPRYSQRPRDYIQSAPRGLAFWETVNELIQRETVEERDRLPRLKSNPLHRKTKRLEKMQQEL